MIMKKLQQTLIAGPAGYCKGWEGIGGAKQWASIETEADSFLCLFSPEKHGIGNILKGRILLNTQMWEISIAVPSFSFFRFIKETNDLFVFRLI